MICLKFVDLVWGSCDKVVLYVTPVGYFILVQPVDHIWRSHGSFAYYANKSSSGFGPSMAIRLCRFVKLKHRVITFGDEIK